MSSLKLIILPLTVVGALIFLWVSVKPVFTKAGQNLGVNKKLVENQIKEEKELQRRTEKLYDEQDSLKDQAGPIINALPGNEEIKNLLAQIEFVVQNDGMILTGVSAESSEDDSNDSSSPSANAFLPVKGKIEVKGSYNQFKQLLNSLKQLDRIVNVESISISGKDSSGTGIDGQFSLDFSAFYQPIISSKSMKSALEAKDITN